MQASESEERSRSRRARRQTVFYSIDVKPVKIVKNSPRISIEIGDIPSNLKPILKKETTNTSSSSASAKKIVKKYNKLRKRKTALFNDKCRIHLVSPLSGWEDGVRMPPDSILMTSTFFDRHRVADGGDSGLDGRIHFNDKLSDYDDDVTTEQPEDIQESLQSLHHREAQENMRKNPKSKNKSLLSWFSSVTTDMDSTLEKENAAFEIAATQSASTEQPSLAAADNIRTVGSLKEKPKRRRSCRIIKAKTVESSRYGDISEYSQQEKPTSYMKPSCSFFHADMLKTQASKSNMIVTNAEKLSKNASSQKKVQRRKSSGFALKSWAENDVVQHAEQNIKNNFDMPLLLPPHVSETGMESSPEVLSVSTSTKCLKTNRQKITPISYSENNVAFEKTGLLKKRNAVDSGYAPVPRLHIFSSIRIVSNSHYFPEKVLDFKKFQTDSDVVSTLYHVPEPPESQLFIELFKISNAEKQAILARLEPREMEYINLFNSCDPSLPWTESFCPNTGCQWLGLSEALTTTRAFLQKWKKRVVKEAELFVSPKEKKAGKLRNSSSDDYDFDFEDEEVANPLILLGPTGCGKTSLVSSVAHELDMNIVEVHPGEKRNAAALKQKIDGTLKNHALRQKSGSIATFLGSTFPTISSSKANIIVIEHVDIYFDEDHDFWSTIKLFAREACVPVIWTCEKLPYTEVRREPELDTYQLVEISRCPSSVVASYIRHCLLVTKNLDASINAIERYINAFECNIRSILANLQFQTAEEDCLKLYLPETTNKHSPATLESKDTSYRDQQEYMNDKKQQYSAVYKHLDIEPESVSNRILMETAGALNERLPLHRLSTDYLPYLVEMDKTERTKKNPKARRRCLHYFESVGSNNERIDTNGSLIPIIRQFSIASAELSCD